MEEEGTHCTRLFRAARPLIALPPARSMEGAAHRTGSLNDQGHSAGGEVWAVALSPTPRQEPGNERTAGTLIQTDVALNNSWPSDDMSFPGTSQVDALPPGDHFPLPSAQFRRPADLKHDTDLPHRPVAARFSSNARASCFAIARYRPLS